MIVVTLSREVALLYVLHKLKVKIGANILTKNKIIPVSRQCTLSFLSCLLSLINPCEFTSDNFLMFPHHLHLVNIIAQIRRILDLDAQ